MNLCQKRSFRVHILKSDESWAPMPLSKIVSNETSVVLERALVVGELTLHERVAERFAKANLIVLRIAISGQTGDTEKVAIVRAGGFTSMPLDLDACENGPAIERLKLVAISYSFEDE